jgi:hypothetical protein
MPAIVRDAVKQNWEIVAHGIDMGKRGELYALPTALEIADLRLLHTDKHRTDEYTEELLDHFKLLPD